MNANRKADLQRKLAVAPVPKPPSGLAERIKTEIPKELRFDINRERDRLSRSVRFSLAVAASVIVVISSAFVALHVMNIADQPLAVPSPAASRRPLPAGEVGTAQPDRVRVPEKLEEPKKLVARKRKRQAPAAKAEETRVLDAAAKTAPVAAAAPAAPAASAANMQVVPFKDLSRDEQIRILKQRLAQGADRKEIVRAARDAGLTEFADELEKKKP